MYLFQPFHIHIFFLPSKLGKIIQWFSFSEYEKLRGIFTANKAVATILKEILFYKNSLLRILSSFPFSLICCMCSFFRTCLSYLLNICRYSISWPIISCTLLSHNTTGLCIITKRGTEIMDTKGFAGSPKTWGWVFKNCDTLKSFFIHFCMTSLYHSKLSVLWNKN